MGTRRLLGPSPAGITGRCGVDRLLLVALANPLERARCYAEATRRVQYGEHLVVDVCLWCSLVVTQRLSARLVTAPT